MLVLLVSAAVTTSGHQWTFFRGSLITLSGLKGSSVLTAKNGPPEVFGNQRLAGEEVCSEARSFLEAVSRAPGDARLMRIKSHLSLLCESDRLRLARFRRNASFGNRRTIADLCYEVEILDRLGLSVTPIANEEMALKVSSIFAHWGRAVLEQDGDIEKAFRFFRIANRISEKYDPTKAEMYRYECLESVKSISFSTSSYNACEAFDRANPGVLSKTLLGRYYYVRGKYSLTIKYLAEAIDLDEKLGESYYWLARTYNDDGDRDKALFILRKGIRNAPGFSGNYSLLSDLETGER